MCDLPHVKEYLNNKKTALRQISCLWRLPLELEILESRRRSRLSIFIKFCSPPFSSVPNDSNELARTAKRNKSLHCEESELKSELLIGQIENSGTNLRTIWMENWRAFLIRILNERELHKQPLSLKSFDESCLSRRLSEAAGYCTKVAQVWRAFNFLLGNYNVNCNYYVVICDLQSNNQCATDQESHRLSSKV